MSLILRPYQQDATSQVEHVWEMGTPRVILVLPTGGGKTECAKHLTRNASNPLLIAHRRSLVEQARRRLGIECISVQGLRARQRRGEGMPNGMPDLIVWDEVHHGDSPDWQAVFELVPESTRMLGLTATPWRFDHGTNKDSRKKNARYGKGLGDLFGAMIIGVRPRDLVASGYLVPLKVLDLVAAENERARRAAEPLPFKGGKIGAGDDIRLDIVDAWQKYGEGRKTMVFCHLVAAAEQAAQRFNAMGVPCEVVHGKLTPAEVERRMLAFKENRFKVLCNVMQLTEGVDVPDVSCIVIDRGANELNTYLQICGRAARPAPGKDDGLILDLTGCSVEHGDPQKDQEYWIVTSEGRNLSDQRCEVCGTRVSPMFPGRCMRCDPFRPKLGAPQALLDTGARVYAALADITKAHQPELMAGTADQDAIDREAISTLDEMIATMGLQDGELAVAEEERTRCLHAIEKRELERSQARRAAEEAARREQLRIELEQRREAERKAFEERLAAQRAEREKRKAELDALAAERDRLDGDGPAYQHTAKLEGDAANTVKLMLSQKFEQFRSRGWGLSGAAKAVRDAHPRWKGKYEYANYTIPPELCQFCGQLDAQSNGELSAYELERMLKDQRTAQYGEAWCRKKVRQLFAR